MAGFEVSLNGRFWVSPEVCHSKVGSTWFSILQDNAREELTMGSGQHHSTVWRPPKRICKCAGVDRG